MNNDAKELKMNDSMESGITCGNCWGHQEYEEDYVGKLVDVDKGKKDNFLI